jgi:hypothetical protein
LTLKIKDVYNQTIDLRIKIHSDKGYGMRKLVIDRNNSFVIQIKDRKRTDSARNELYNIGRMKKKEKFNKTSLAKFKKIKG